MFAVLLLTCKMLKLIFDGLFENEYYHIFTDIIYPTKHLSSHKNLICNSE